MTADFLTLDDKERIKAEILGNCDLVADCWIYKGAVNDGGYGVKKIAGTARTVSRFMLAYTTRESIVKHGWDACHKDDVCPYKACCNPDHLYWATKSDNCKAREKRAREERELFRFWKVYSDRSCPLDIDHCLAGLNRGKIVHAATVIWEDESPENSRKVFCFLADISRQTWERMQGISNPV